MTLLLKRLAQLRDGAAFHRPMVRPVLATELFDRYAQWVFITVAVLLGGGSLLAWGCRLRRRRLSLVSALRVERAQTYADLAAVGAQLVAADSRTAADPTLLGQAAERHATARNLLTLADTPGAVRAAQAVAAEARRLLARAAGRKA